MSEQVEITTVTPAASGSPSFGYDAVRPLATSDGRQILHYALPPEQVSPLARQSEVVIVLVGLILPGLPSWLIRGRAGAAVFFVCWGVLAAAFGFFGPLWGEVLFASAGKPWREAGLWPFLAICAATAVSSALLALQDRNKALGSRREGGSANEKAPHVVSSRFHKGELQFRYGANVQGQLSIVDIDFPADSDPNHTRD
jgi:hypothetical protein